MNNSMSDIRTCLIVNSLGHIREKRRLRILGSLPTLGEKVTLTKDKLPFKGRQYILREKKPTGVLVVENIKTPKPKYGHRGYRAVEDILNRQLQEET